LKNLLVILLITVLIFQNVLALYAGVCFTCEDQFSPTGNNNGQPEELCYTQADSDIINQFIFDSEFKNINASVSVFEEHKNLNSEIKYLFSDIPTLNYKNFLSGIIYKSNLLSVQLVIASSFQLALQGNFFSFRI
jgi:hypothetical protein